MIRVLCVLGLLGVQTQTLVPDAWTVWMLPLTGDLQTVAPIARQITPKGWAMCDQDPSPDPIPGVILRPPLVEIDDPQMPGRACRLLWPPWIPAGTYRVVVTASAGLITTPRVVGRPPTYTVKPPAPAVTCRADEQAGEATITGTLGGKFVKLRTAGCVPKGSQP